EAEHVEGFAPETAVVTHGGGKKLEEPLIVRPTSETIIYAMFAKWVQSYRDLPLLINQWANVVRWEMRTLLFLRTLEFLWQEGHTAHATHDEAEEEARKILGLYRDFMEGWMAMPVITGLKTESERFAGALRTYACEALMQDNKAMQAGWERRDPGRLRIHLDARQGIKPGAKYYEWELRGVPLRMEIGPKDLDKNQAILVRRDTGEKRPVSLDTVGEDASDLLARIQLDMLAAARERQDKNSIRGVADYDRFKEIMEADGGFVYAGWCGDAACEATIKEETKATIRVLPDEEFRSAEAPARCLRCGKSAASEAVWAKAY